MQFDGDINLLVVNDDLDNANQLINLLSDASYVVNSTIVAERHDLVELLNEQEWSLALVQYEGKSIRARDFMSQLSKRKLHIPSILITTESDPSINVEGLRMGADYVVQTDEDQYFLLVVAASLDKLRQRQEQEYWQKRYLEAELRCDGLMDNSKDGIAIIQEGAFVYANEGYALLFGYQDPDDMVLLPVVDTIADSSKTELNPYLKTLSTDHPLASAQVEIKGITPDDTDLQTIINITQVLFQSEPALQFLISKDLLSQEVEQDESGKASKETETAQPALSDIQTDKALNALNKALLKAERIKEKSLLLCLRIDPINEYIKSSGTAYADSVITAIMERITALVPAARALIRYSEDTIMMLVDIKTLDTGHEFAEQLLSDIAVDNFSIGDDEENIAVSATIAIKTLIDVSESPLEQITQCQKVISEGDQTATKFDKDHRIYSVESNSEMEVKSEQQVLEFGRKLLDQRLIGIHFQPVVSLQENLVEYYGVLMRPKIEEYPEAVPEDFIFRVFKTDVAVEIDRWVILESIKCLSEKLVEHPETKLLINLCALTIRDGGFIPWLKVALTAANVSPSSLIFQVRETDVGHYIDQTAELIQQLKSLQAKTALTHFGLAINPLFLLEKLDVDIVKLDGELINQALKGNEELASLEALLSSVRELPTKTIVPYIESPTLMPTLWKHGVEYIQGRYIQEPMPNMEYDFTE
jgi:EAL domain-containing protein (putative c-di-GMP-specific phosphodiesterase class I)/GGDEF domain-containing protein/PAS domain-containing protein